RADADKTQDQAELRKVPIALTAGWGNRGSVLTQKSMPPPPAMASPLAGGMPAAAPASLGGMAPGGAPPAPKAKKADAPRQRAREQSKGGGGILSRLLGRGSSGERTEATPTAMDAYAGDDGFAMFDKAE